ncbi:MAG: hypothetical protein L0H31_04195 [Nocardioidaceae bacterium]|nr:hypothetical protein [Nocardioidaceae bacterium]
MGSDDEFGPDTATIRAWLAQRVSYTNDTRIVGTPHGDTPSPAPRESAEPRDRTPTAPLDERDIGRSIVDALTTPTPEPSTTGNPPATTPPSSRSTRSPRGTGTAGSGTDIDFPVRSGIRRTMTVILLICVAATGAAGYLAGKEQTPVAVGVTAILGFLTLVVWAVRATCSTARLSLRRGKLSVQRNGLTEVVDVGNHFTPMAMVGQPGDRRWTVLVERPGQPLLVITSSMVDPVLFSDALYRLRPELSPER